MNKLTLQDVELHGKRLLMRVDFNVPLDEHRAITDDNRIRAALPSIEYAVDKGAKVILMSHLGRPKGSVVPGMSLKPVAERLSSLLGRPVGFAPDCVGADVEHQTRALRNGAVLLLENLRFHPEETANDPGFAAQLAALGDVYANDAFGTAHRAHASTVGVTAHFDACVSGFLMEKELRFLGGAVTRPDRPYIAILGGAKIADKIPVIEHIIGLVDAIIIGGGMMFTFLKAAGKEIGDSMLDAESLELAAGLLAERAEQIVLPVDCVVSDRFDFAAREIGSVKTVSVDDIPAGWKGLDIGPRSIEAFKAVCHDARTIIWNGPMGVFELEATSRGTLGIAAMLAELTDQGATTIIGGGDSAAAVKKAGLEARMSHVSTGGGASLEFLEGKVLPGVAALTDREGEWA
ncbi:phosphoglycerate kinase [bacterium]|nr:phosphoglycerate kinase [bacterium]